ncbi:MAG TPA: hypothetical protein VF524_13505 [Polyangia bacterium]
MKAIAFALTAAVLAISSQAVAAARISSNSNCPSSDAISIKLLGLLAAGGPESASARVRSEGDSMRIEVATPGEESRQRTVPVSGDCESRAEMAAFIIAAWLDAMPVGAVSTPGVPPREVRHLPRAAGEADPPDEAEGERLSISTRTFLAAGVFGLGDGLGASAGLLAAVGMPTLVENVGWLLEASMTSSRQMKVGQGTAHIWRPTLVLSATFEVNRKRWLLRAQVGPALGILLVNGTDYRPNRNDTSVMWGADVGLTLARPWKHHQMWVRLDAVAWPQGRSVLSKQGPSSPDVVEPLPGSEVRVALGFSLGIL